MKACKNLPLRLVLNRIGEPTLAEYGASQKPLDTPKAVQEFWHAVIASRPDHELDKEHLVSILLNAKLRPLGYHLVSIGSLSECVAHPREILRPAIAAAAFGFVLAHNHPSGDPTPSEADRRLTTRIRDAAELLQVYFVDHLVIGSPTPTDPQAIFSFKSAGIL